MSKARLVITAVIVEKRPVSEVAREYGVARSWVYGLLARYQAEGEAAFEPRSRRPKTSPSAIKDQTADLIVGLRKELAEQGMDAGPHTIRWHLEHHHGIAVSAAAISRYLSARGLIVPEPRKRPRSSCIRFQAEQPNECWQSGFTRYPLAGGTGTEILTWTRRPLPVRPVRHRPRTRPRPHRPDRLPGRRRSSRRPGLHPDRQRHGLHHPVFRRQRRPQRPGSRAAEPGHHPEERQAEPPPDPGKSRAVPAGPQELARRPEPAARHAGPAPVPPRAPSQPPATSTV